MTRINTNVASQVAQNALQQSEQQLNTSLQRLSTGLQINSGADNPAGYIAAQELGSEIVSANAGISNSQQADELISTAESALNQVSNLLNNIRGLVSDAANTGAQSASQIAADQLQVNSSLQAIDSIAQTTSFQGSQLLDGSLDFLTTSAGTADLRASGTFGTTTNSNAAGSLSGTVTDASATGSFGSSTTTAASAEVTGSTGAVTINAGTNGFAANGYSLTFTNAGTSTSATDAVTVNTSSKTITASLTSGATAAQAKSALNANSSFSSLFSATATTSGVLFASTTSGHSLTAATTAGGNDVNQITVTATHAGTAYNGIDVTFSNTASNGSETASFNSSTSTLTVYKSATSNANQVVAAINSTGLFSASTSGDGLGTYSANYTNVTSGGQYNNSLKLSAVNAGSSYNNVAVDFINTAAQGSETANYNSTNNTLYVYKNASSTTNQVISAINATGDFVATTSGSGSGTYAAGTTDNVTSGGANGNQFTLSAHTGGAAYNNVSVKIVDNASAGSETATYSALTNTLTVNANAASTTNQIVAAINGATGGNAVFSATTIGSGLGTYAAGTTTDVTSGGGTGGNAISNLQINEANFGTASSVPVDVTIQKQATQAQLTYSGGSLSSATTLQIGGTNGYQVFNFGAGATVSQIAQGINSSSDATGVTAAVNGSNLVLSSESYGSSAFVSATALSGTFATTDSSNAAATRATGTDIQAQINGVQAIGNGLQASVDTPNLNLSFNVNSNFTSGDSFNFSITGGGANFQLGPDVQSNEQARLGIQGVSTATLGGADGTLYELQSGGAAALANNPELAANIVNEVLNQVTDESGELGAFQSTTLQTNINTLTTTVSNLTSAQSNIQDADFAAESANLTRAQILVQSGTSVLSIANQNPQQVLSLLKNS